MSEVKSGILSDHHAGATNNLGIKGKLLTLITEVFAEHLKFGVKCRASLLHCIFRFQVPIGLNSDLDALLEWMRLLVASEANPVILQKLVADDVAKGMILLLDENGAGVLTSSIINTLDEIAWLDLS